MRRLFVIALLCVAAGPLWLATQPATAASLSDCTSDHGTVVVVNYGHWQGPAVVGCANAPQSGYALLHQAGFTTAGDLHDGPAFICRLGDRVFHRGTQYPTPSQDACVLTPPASAYWSYWLAYAGQNHWSYSELGAMADKPKPGEVELWTFGGTTINGAHGSGVPTLTPDQIRRFVAAHDGGKDSVPGDGQTQAGPTMVAAVATTKSDDAGSALPTIIGACLVVLLGAGALLAVRRRRRYG